MKYYISSSSVLALLATTTTVVSSHNRDVAQPTKTNRRRHLRATTAHVPRRRHHPPIAGDNEGGDKKLTDVGLLATRKKKTGSEQEDERAAGFELLPSFDVDGQDYDNSRDVRGGGVALAHTVPHKHSDSDGHDYDLSPDRHVGPDISGGGAALELYNPNYGSYYDHSRPSPTRYSSVEPALKQPKIGPDTPSLHAKWHKDPKDKDRRPYVPRYNNNHPEIGPDTPSLRAMKLNAAKIIQPYGGPTSIPPRDWYLPNSHVDDLPKGHVDDLPKGHVLPTVTAEYVPLLEDGGAMDEDGWLAPSNDSPYYPDDGGETPELGYAGYDYPISDATQMLAKAF